MRPKKKAAPKRAPRPAGGRTAVLMFDFLGSSRIVRVQKSLAGFLAQCNTNDRPAMQVVLVADGRLFGGHGRWLPHEGWTDAELDALGFLCVGEGAARRWVAPEDRP